MIQHVSIANSDLGAKNMDHNFSKLAFQSMTSNISTSWRAIFFLLYQKTQPQSDALKLRIVGIAPLVISPHQAELAHGHWADDRNER